MSPHFYAYLDSCITVLPQDYSHMQVQGHAKGTYLFRIAKESAFHSPIYRLIHRLVVSTICHYHECDKVPFCDLFYMPCLTQTELILFIWILIFLWDVFDTIYVCFWLMVVYIWFLFYHLSISNPIDVLVQSSLNRVDQAYVQE